MKIINKKITSNAIKTDELFPLFFLGKDFFFFRIFLEIF